MGATLLDRTTGPQTEADIAAAGDTRYLLDTRLLNINGGVEVSQELGLTGLTVPNNTNKYAADMWGIIYSHAAATAVVTAGQISSTSFPVALNGFPNGLQVKATTALSAPANGDYSLMRTPIEGYRVARLGWGAANPSSISYGFWFYATASGTIFTRIVNGGTSRAYHHEHAVVGGIWNWCAWTVPGDTTGTWAKDNTIGMLFDIFIAGKSATPAVPDAWSGTYSIQTTNSTNLLGANNNLCIVTGLVVVPGTAIPNSLRLFGNMRTFDEEYALCKRYYFKTFPYGVPPAQNAGYPGCHGVVTSIANAIPSYPLRFPAEMRATPTQTYYNPIAANNQWSAGGVAAVDAGNPAPSGAAIYPSYLVGPSIGAGSFTSIHIVSDARL